MHHGRASLVVGLLLAAMAHAPNAGASQCCVNVIDYGAKGNGTTDDTAAFQNAINSTTGSVCVPYSAAGYKINGTLSMASRKSITGQNRVALIKTGTGNLFQVVGSNVEIADFYLDMGGSASGSSGVYVDTSSGSYDQITISNMYVTGAYHIIADANTTSSVYTGLRVDNVQSRYSRDVQFYLRNAFAYVFLKDCAVDFVGNNPNPTFDAFYISNNQGCVLEDCDVNGLGSLAGSPSTAAGGFHFVNSAAIWMRRCMADTVPGTGFLFDSCLYIYLDDAVASLCRHAGFRFASCSFVNAPSVVSAGSNNVSGAPASQNGIELVSTQCAQFGTVSVRDNTGHGLSIQNSTNCNVTNLQARTNAGRGISETGTSNYNIVNGCQCIANTTGNLSIVGTGTHLVNIILNSGAFQANIVGPSTL